MPSKEYYQNTRFLKAKEASRHIGRTVSAVATAEGELEYYLVAGGNTIGKLDFKRLWVRQLIQSQELASGGRIVNRRISQDDDGFGVAGEPD